MVDEVTIIWGDNPAPDDDRFNGIDIGNGITYDFGDDAFVDLMDTINSAQSRANPNRRPPLSWPVRVLDGGEAAANWMGDSRFSDYASMNSWPGFHPEGMFLFMCFDVYFFDFFDIVISYYDVFTPLGPSRHFFNQLESAIEVYLLDGQLPFVDQERPMLGYISSGKLFNMLACVYFTLL